VRGELGAPVAEGAGLPGAARRVVLRIARKGEREAYFEGAFQTVGVYDGLKLVNGNVVPGPAIIEQPTTTIVLPPGFTARCDEHDNYRVER
jgi:N-methylhydantoinase A